jgi:hypothetical protein
VKRNRAAVVKSLGVQFEDESLNQMAAYFDLCNLYDCIEANVTVAATDSSRLSRASVQVSLPYDYSGSVAVSGKVLFDSGASHDFVAPKIAQALNLLPGKQNAFRITTANGVVSGTFPVLELLMKIALHHEGETIHISIRTKLIEFETGEDVVVSLAT